MLADDIVQIRKLRRKDLEPASETMAPQDAEPLSPVRIRQQVGVLREAPQRVAGVACRSRASYRIRMVRA
jgi:hypothetical protein